MDLHLILTIHLLVEDRDNLIFTFYIVHRYILVLTYKYIYIHTHTHIHEYIHTYIHTGAHSRSMYVVGSKFSGLTNFLR